MLLISRDVTDRVRAQTQLRESEERYRVLAETTHDLVIELDAEGKVVYVSPNSLATLGYSPGEMRGTLPFALLHPDDVERLAAPFLEPRRLVRAARTAAPSSASDTGTVHGAGSRAAASTTAPRAATRASSPSCAT